MNRIMEYPAGSILVMTSGQYSDFRNCGFLVTVKDIDLKTLAQEYAAERRPIDGVYLDLDCFPSWLVKNGYAMPVDYQQVHIGDYGEFNGEFCVPDA